MEINMDFKGKNVIVTGASGAIGCALCKKLSENGAFIAAASHTEDGAKAIASELGENCFSMSVDVTKEAEVIKFYKAAVEKQKKFDYLVNLAGLSMPCKYDEAEESLYDTVMDVNVKGSFLMSKHFAGYANDPAMIINTGSMAARNTNANAPVYCMAKGAVNKLSEGLFLQYAKRGIRVTTVNPGGVDTPFWGDRPVDRTALMTAENVSDIIYFLMTTPSHVQIHSIDFECTAKFKK